MATPKPPLPSATDTQYGFPDADSRFKVMRYGDGWSVYCTVHDHLLFGLDDHPLEFQTAESAENFLRYMMCRSNDSDRVM